MRVICGLFTWAVLLAVVPLSWQAAVAQAIPNQAEHPSYPVGKMPDGGFVLPTDQKIHPAGRSIPFLGRPVAIALRPDHRSVAVLKTMGGFDRGLGYEPNKPLVVFDSSSGKVIQEFKPDDAVDASFTGLAYSQDGSKLFASDPSGVVVAMDVASDGTLIGARKISLPVGDPARKVAGSANVGGLVETTGKTAYPGGIAVSQDGRRIYVALSLNNSLAVMDVASGALIKEIPVGNAPFAVVSDARYAYVSNQGGRVASTRDATRLSGGTPVVVNPTTGRPLAGSVSVVDLDTNEVVANIDVGLGPTAMILFRSLLFVANTNSDTISVIDTHTRTVIKTISVQLYPGALFGSSPNALAMVSNNRLVVTLAANNALAVYNWNGPAESVTLEGLIPTAWYPSGVVFDPRGGRVMVANLKGMGSGPLVSSWDGDETKDMSSANVEKESGRTSLYFVGSLSLISLPSRAMLAKQTRTVLSGNSLFRKHSDDSVRSTAPPRAIPERIGEASLIKHIFYIIKENHKYDEDLGDDPRGNGWVNNVEFGAKITPNQHALVKQFPLLDNFYNSATASYDGHSWSDSAFVTDYIERAWGGFKRGYGVGGDPLSDPSSGFLWEDALRHGKAVQIFGEAATHFDGPRTDVSWDELFHDSKVLEGKSIDPLSVKIGDFKARSDIPSVDALLYRPYPGLIVAPDQYRADILLQEFRAHIERGDLPDLTLVTLPSDHTVGETPGQPTPTAMVADNDLALGRIAEAISNSPYWKNSAIFVVEDDAAYGVDHVDGHRSTVYIVSPFARRGLVDHTYYTQIDVVRTIEQILGIPPMNQRDLAASPMFTAFTDIPVLAPFVVLPNQVPLDDMTPSKGENPIEHAWLRESMKLFSGKVDSGDDNLTKRAIWYATFAYKRPFPGDERVLLPSEVTHGRRRSNDD